MMSSNYRCLLGEVLLLDKHTFLSRSCMLDFERKASWLEIRHIHSHVPPALNRWTGTVEVAFLSRFGWESGCRPVKRSVLM